MSELLQRFNPGSELPVNQLGDRTGRASMTAARGLDPITDWGDGVRTYSDPITDWGARVRYIDPVTDWGDGTRIYADPITNWGDRVRQVFPSTRK